MPADPKPMLPDGAAQEKSCWLCQSVNAIQGKCLYHRLEPLLGHARCLSVDLEAVAQNRNEWEQRALKAEAELASRPHAPATQPGRVEELEEMNLCSIAALCKVQESKTLDEAKEWAWKVMMKDAKVALPTQAQEEKP